MAKKKSAKTSKKQPKAKKKSFLLFTLKWGLVASIWGALILTSVIAYYCYDLPDIARAAEFNRKRSITVYAADNKTVIGRYGELLGKNITYEDLPPQLVHAVLATEDRRFFYHFGIDPIGIFRAAVTNLQSNRIAQGGSTITQQLAKNMFLSSERTIKRKIQEAILALWLEHKLTKKEILAAYLNRVYMGAGAYGVDAAAQIYFQKPVNALTTEESAILAGLLKAPSKYNPKSNPKEARKRMQVVLQLMEDNPLLKFDRLKEKKSSARMAKNNVILPPEKPFNIIHSFNETRYFTNWVIDLIPDFVNSPDADLKVYTTLDLNLQKQAQAAALKYTKAYAEGRKKVTEAPEFSAILANKNGAVIVMLGGSNYGKSQFNRATQAMRQPGSSFKPFVYLTALRAGRNMDDYISDEPFEKNGYAPENYNGEFHGEVPLWEALMNSYNVATVRLLDETGIASVIRTAQNLGITSKIQPDLSVALGSSETTLLQMTQAYNSIARFRQKNRQLYAITSIKLANGQPLYEMDENAISATTSMNIADDDAYQMEQLTAMLQAVVQYGTGRRADLGFPVAGKTGTSQNNRDAWFLGFTSDFTAGIWVGYDNNKEMPGVYGGTIPASIWRDIVKAAYKGKTGASLLSRGYSFNYDNPSSYSYRRSYYSSNDNIRSRALIDRNGRPYTDKMPRYENAPIEYKNTHPKIKVPNSDDEDESYKKYKTRLGNNPNSFR